MLPSVMESPFDELDSEESRNSSTVHACLMGVTVIGARSGVRESGENSIVRTESLGEAGFSSAILESFRDAVASQF